MSTQAIGQFQVLGNLGSGAHSKILHIRCSGDGKQYALKVVPIASRDDHKFLEQAQHEFRVAQKLNHPNLIKVYALEIERTWLFRVKKAHLLIEYVNGKTLDTVPRLSIPRLAQIFARIAAGLVHMHRRGVYHADLKPNNILLSRTGEVKVIDYGLAWIKGEPKERVQGTPEYMAPEQSRQGTVNEQTDLYNFGATMYRLVTWRHPPSTMPVSDGVTMNAKAFKALLRPVEEFTPQAPRELADLIHRCLEFNPQKRPERANAVQIFLEKLADDLVRKPEDSLENMEW
jgi:eukaryotic-like serine/threonine-protein kinase